MATTEQKIEKLTWFNSIDKLKDILRNISNRVILNTQAITALQVNTSITGYLDFSNMSNTLISFNDVDPTLLVTQNPDDSVTFTIANGGFTTNKTIPILPGANIIAMTNNTIQVETSTALQLYFKIEVYL